MKTEPKRPEGPKLKVTMEGCPSWPNWVAVILIVGLIIAAFLR